MFSPFYQCWIEHERLSQRVRSPGVRSLVDESFVVLVFVLSEQGCFRTWPISTVDMSMCQNRRNNKSPKIRRFIDDEIDDYHRTCKSTPNFRVHMQE